MRDLINYAQRKRARQTFKCFFAALAPIVAERLCHPFRKRKLD